MAKKIKDNIKVFMKVFTQGKKGFVFSLDIAIAVLVTILILAAAHRHMADAEKNSISDMQMVSVGSDVIAMLDYKDILQTLDQDLIQSRMNDLVPQNYHMLLKIVVDDGTVLFIGDSMPQEQFVGAGKRFFTIKGQDSIKNYGYVSYWIWVR